MSTPLAPEPPRFSVAGLIAGWDPVARVLQIIGRELWVPADVAIAGLEPGLDVIAHGHWDERSRRWMMTRVDSGSDGPAHLPGT